MPKQKLFDVESEEEEVSFKTENEYAKKYDKWREKEELHKLEQKYGSKALSSDASVSSDSEDESDEPPEVSEEMETQFLKTLALLKTKDPRIYDPSFKCFDVKEEKKEEKQAAEKTLTFEDSDDDESGDGAIFKVEKKAEIDIPDKKKDTTAGKDGKLKDFLIGKVDHLGEPVEKDLAPLKALWSDPALNEGEAFLRDYILNKRYLEEGDVGEAEDKVRDDEDLEEDEKRVEEQGKFERAYNFRFEEPDEEYLKRYPRTMNYTRPKDDRRSKKRAEVRSRKEEEKKKKMEEIARMKALKLKEIQEKIAKIKEVTGNEELAFKEEDIEGDFDPEEHDRRMQALFDEQFYGGEERHKPTFPDLDRELEIENWENYDPELERHEQTQNSQIEDGPHCEDEHFNMDADYDPKQARANLIEEIQASLGKKRRNRKKKSKLAQLLATDKPKFVPTVSDKTYEEYMEEYYKMDCEDVIAGELPTRFKYRRVPANDFGLSIEEILLADDKELTQWVPLKKIVKHRPEDVEKSEINTYKLKAADVRLKKKILPSLFKDLPEEPEIIVPIEEAKKKKKKKKKNKEHGEETENANIDAPQESNDEEYTKELIEENVDENKTETKKKKNKKKKHKEDDNISTEVNINTEINEEVDHKNHKKKHKTPESVNDNETNNVQVEKKQEFKKKKRKDSMKTEESSQDVVTKIEMKSINKDVKATSQESTEAIVKDLIKNDNTQVNGQGNKKKKKKKHKADGFVVENVQKLGPSQTGQQGINNKKAYKRKSDQQGPTNNKKQKFNKKHKDNKFKNKEDKSTDPLAKLSDERLKAYGLNPKKYRSFLKYKKF